MICFIGVRISRIKFKKWLIITAKEYALMVELVKKRKDKESNLMKYCIFVQNLS